MPMEWDVSEQLNIYIIQQTKSSVEERFLDTRMNRNFACIAEFMELRQCFVACLYYEFCRSEKTLPCLLCKVCGSINNIRVV